MNKKDYDRFAAQIRLETVKTIGARGFGHAGGALSIVDALAVLYSDGMRIDPLRPDWADRDKLVMSKGHAGPALYATLALKGYFPRSWLETLNQPATRLPSHCDGRLTPGVDMTTGSLGQGVSTAIGLALAQKMDGQDRATFLITGDGELDEGQCWEGALFAPNHGLDNLVWLVDHNKKQLDGTTAEVNDLGDICAKFSGFGWKSLTIDGGDTAEIKEALEEATRSKGQPTCIVLDTIKGGGVPCIESIPLNHHIPLEGALLQQAVSQCESILSKL